MACIILIPNSLIGLCLIIASARRVSTKAREQLMEEARRREIDEVLVWRLDRWGTFGDGSARDPAGTGASRCRFRLA